MMDAIFHSLARLFDASGRDRRSTFWWYMLAVQLLMALISFVAVMTLASGMESADDPKALTGSLWLGIASSLVMLVLVAASVVRRLHDSGLTGWIAALPGTLYLVTVARMPEVARELEKLPEGEMSSASTGNLLLDWLPTLIVILIGLLPSTPGANRYGEEGE